MGAGRLQAGDGLGMPAMLLGLNEPQPTLYSCSVLWNWAGCKVAGNLEGAKNLGWCWQGLAGGAGKPLPSTNPKFLTPFLLPATQHPTTLHGAQHEFEVGWGTFGLHHVIGKWGAGSRLPHHRAPGGGGGDQQGSCSDDVCPSPVLQAPELLAETGGSAPSVGSDNVPAGQPWAQQVKRVRTAGPDSMFPWAAKDAAVLAQLEPLLSQAAEARGGMARHC